MRRIQHGLPTFGEIRATRLQKSEIKKMPLTKSLELVKFSYKHCATFSGHRLSPWPALYTYLPTARLVLDTPIPTPTSKT